MDRIEFTCVYYDEQEDDVSLRHLEWPGTLEIMSHEGNLWEITINARHTKYDVVYGKYSQGYFLVWPFWEVGCALADPANMDYNRDCLTDAGMPEVDARSISMGLKEAAEYFR